jgi:hypothetical protein
MPEHVAIVYDHAGNCPICGMALVPVTASALKKIQPGGKVLYYTCPMPEHANVHEEQAGQMPAVRHDPDPRHVPTGAAAVRRQRPAGAEILLPHASRRHFR